MNQHHTNLHDVANTIAALNVVDQFAILAIATFILVTYFRRVASDITKIKAERAAIFAEADKQRERLNRIRAGEDK